MYIISLDTYPCCHAYKSKHWKNNELLLNILTVATYAITVPLIEIDQ